MGWQTVQFVEIDEFCQSVLRKNFPGVAIHGDLRTFERNESHGAIGILTAGYPCQPFSMAGRRRGQDDDRHLWPQVFRIIDQCRPNWVLCENVAGHITMGLDTVLSDLESAGYSSRALVIPACAANAPHRRDRVWIIANAHDNGREEQRRARNDEPEYATAERRRGDAGDTDDGTRRRPFTGNSFRQAERGFCRGNDGFSGWVDADRVWQTPPLSYETREEARASQRVNRLKALGNAIVPQVAFQIFQAIAEAEKQ